ncbi:hypothetical protein A3D43_00145 [Candidatus Nomurabacteria bacterium RIFCSPHIGHO2_02_FULL_41_52]|nr:MAG: hypothetical protein A3D43_00145 [Candidatus Nomurabacteria bacterium RIFCSPHIGHO2_02_FULL_41_52]
MENIKYQKIVIAIIVGILIYPSITLAVWWNPASWFRKNIKPVEQTTVIQVKPNNLPIEVKQKPTEKKISEKKVPAPKVNNTEKKSTKEVAIPITPMAPVWDVCKNIEGIQTLAPDGMYVDIGICLSFLNSQYVTPTIIPDKISPWVFLKKMTNYWVGRNDYYDKKEDAFHGILRLWISSSIFEDPEPSSGIVKMEYYLDQTLIGVTNDPRMKAYGEYMTIAWDTTQHADGKYNLVLKVYDKAGNVGTDYISINIKNNKESTQQIIPFQSESIEITAVQDPNFVYSPNPSYLTSKINSLVIKNNSSQKINITKFEFNLSDINGEPLSSYTNPKITEISGFYTSEKRIGTGSDVIAPQKKINFEVNFTINAETNKIIDIFANISNKEPFIISLKATGMTIP